MTSGRVSFVGAGPGAADLITLRGAKRIAEADIVVWAASLVDPACVREHARPDAELIDSSRITHDEVVDVYRRAAASRLKVARVHSGDPSLWGAVQEQYDSAQRLGLDVEIVPGVSAFSAAAAIAGRELTVPEVAQSLILTRLEGGKTPMPDGEHIREFARHGTTMAIFLSAARSGQLVDELRAGGYADDTPVVVAYKATWPDELVLHTTLGELSDTVKKHKLWRHTLFLVGKALRSGGTRSHLYNAGHFHTYRKADPLARRALRAGREAATGPVAPPTEAPELTADTTAESVESTESGGGSGTTARPKGAGWPLSTSRSGWVAARVATGGWSGGTAEHSSGKLTGASQPASEAAWSAVQGWQETARSTSRGGRGRAATESQRALRPVSSDQGAFALDSDAEAAESEPNVTASPTVTASPDVTAVADVRLVDSGDPAAQGPTGVATSQVGAAAVDKPRPPKQGGRRNGSKRGGARRSGGRPDQQDGGSREQAGSAGHGEGTADGRGTAADARDAGN
jgi:precorrin-4 C11-methyltransferase